MIRCSLVIACAAGLLVGAVGADSKKELASLTGKWKPTFMHFGETKLKEEQLKDRVLTLEDGKYSFTDGKVIDKGTVTLDTKPEKKTMDIKGTEGPNKGKTLLAIYEIDGDTLRICYGLDGKRPTEFKVTGDKLLMITYKKVKEEKK